MKIKTIDGGVCSAKGFKAAAAAIKYAGRDDVALVVADAPCAAAAMFTTNKVAAAPVVYDRRVVKSGRIQAILANSGCANACTGEAGLKDAEFSALVTAGELGIDPSLVLVASTGVIGRRLPVDRLAAGVKAAAKALGRSREKSLAVAKPFAAVFLYPQIRIQLLPISHRKRRAHRMHSRAPCGDHIGVIDGVGHGVRGGMSSLPPSIDVGSVNRWI
ncbi:MAG: bifunctional ornithine acetyltransferase/N-acetylglutamate synthase [Kiritimatiellae bacterium]|nr:bifunctional ornithine acetyltransferase/N-acetylglutamate synthase [Kiritimatiellia bacterium]